MDTFPLATDSSTAAVAAFGDDSPASSDSCCFRWEIHPSKRVAEDTQDLVSDLTGPLIEPGTRWNGLLWVYRPFLNSSLTCCMLLFIHCGLFITGCRIMFPLFKSNTELLMFLNRGSMGRWGGGGCENWVLNCDCGWWLKLRCIGWGLALGYMKELRLDRVFKSLAMLLERGVSFIHMPLSWVNWEREWFMSRGSTAIFSVTYRNCSIYFRASISTRALLMLPVPLLVRTDPI